MTWVPSDGEGVEPRSAGGGAPWKSSSDDPMLSQAKDCVPAEAAFTPIDASGRLTGRVCCAVDSITWKFTGQKIACVNKNATEG